MPRRRPDEVTVHRVEMGDWEREQVESLLMAEKVSKLALGLGIGAGVGAAGLATWFTLQKMHGWKEDIADAFDRATNGLGAEVIFGKGTYTDAEGNEVKNPFAGIPLVGSLFGSGIMVGQAFNPFR